MILKLISLSFLLFELVTFGQQWEQMSNTPFTKDHGVGFSLDGFGYVLTGGQNGQVFSATKDFFKYDPSTDTWEQLTDFPGTARGYAIGDVYNGKVYFGFGLSSNGILLNDLWSWEASTNTFAQMPSCPCAGRVHPALIADNGKVFVGAGGASGNLNDWWEFDIVTQVWSQKASMPGQRHHPYQFAIDGDIYVGNGHLDSWNKYTVATNSWTAVESLVARVAGAQFSYNGKGYALSGTDVNHNRFPTGEFWEYDPISDDWTALSPHPGVSRFGPTQFVIDSYIYLAGGYNRFDPTNTMIPVSTMYRYNLGPSSVGLEEEGTSSYKGSIYPNPTNNELNIKLSEEVSGNTIINIYNVSGQLIMSNSFVANLDVSALNSGIYVIDIVDEGVSVLKQKISKI